MLTLLILFLAIAHTSDRKIIVDIIPEFWPNKLDMLAAEQWVRKISNIAYKWDDATTLLQAVSKLRGAVKIWFDTSVGRRAFNLG